MVKTRTIKVGGSSRTGKFIKVKKTQKDKAHSQLETIKVPVKKRK